MLVEAVLVVLVVEDLLMVVEVVVMTLLQVLHKETMVHQEELVEQTIVVVAEVDLAEQDLQRLHLKEEMVEQEQQTILQEVV